MSTLFHPCMHDNVVCGVCTFDLCLCGGGVHVRIVFVIHHMFTYHFVILFISWLIYLDYSSLLLLLLLSLSLSESFHLFRICVLWLSICVIFSTLNLTIDFFSVFCIVLFCCIFNLFRSISLHRRRHKTIHDKRQTNRNIRAFICFVGFVPFVQLPIARDLCKWISFVWNINVWKFRGATKIKRLFFFTK